MTHRNTQSIKLYLSSDLNGATETADKGKNGMPTDEQVIATLKEIIDPHTNMSVYEMGLISDIRSDKDSVSLTFRPTSQFCPLGVHLALNIKRRIAELEGVRSADVKIVGHIEADKINRLLEE